MYYYQTTVLCMWFGVYSHWMLCKITKQNCSHWNWFLQVCPHAGGVGLCEMVQHLQVLLNGTFSTMFKCEPKWAQLYKWAENNQNYHCNRCSILFTWRELLRTEWSNMSAIFTKSSSTLQKWANLGEYPCIFSTLQLGRNIIFLSTLIQLLSTGGTWIQHWSSWGQCQRPRVSSG